MRPKSLIRPLIVRPTLLTGALTMVGLFTLLTLLTPLPLTSRLIAAWDVGLAVYLLLAFLLMMRRVSPEKLAERAARLDESAGVILALSLLAAGAAVVAVGAEIVLAKGDAGPDKAWRLLAIAGTVALSWTFVHQMFALHYAHEFYGARNPADTSAGKRRKDGLRGGLIFPGTDPTPDYWDFLHFALVIGVANQTADVQIESRSIRQTVTLHGIIAFLFNTVILALSINLASSLFSS